MAFVIRYMKKKLQYKKVTQALELFGNFETEDEKNIKIIMCMSLLNCLKV